MNDLVLDYNLKNGGVYFMGLIELAFIRNELYKGQVTDEYLETLNEVRKTVMHNNNPYKGLIMLCIDLALKNIELNDYKSAAEEINFIHNFPIKDYLSSWDSDHFFNIELLSYIEKTQDSLKLRKVIKEIAKFC